MLIIGRSNCINTASGIVISVSDRPVVSNIAKLPLHASHVALLSKM